MVWWRENWLITEGLHRIFRVIELFCETGVLVTWLYAFIETHREWTLLYAQFKISATVSKDSSMEYRWWDINLNILQISDMTSMKIVGARADLSKFRHNAFTEYCKAIDKRNHINIVL